MGEENIAEDGPRGPFTNVEDLKKWVEKKLELKLPAKGVCDHHNSPLDYLAAAHIEPTQDLVVWAPRGGGKTRLGAVATLLDLLFKPKCQVRILGGSLEQSLRMWEHLWPDVLKLGEKELNKKIRSTRKLEMNSGASAAILTQSERAVRGLRVQKLRCDEVELFDAEVWEAAQLITKTIPGAVGTVEAFSTMHKTRGLMSRIVERAEKGGAKLIRWCILDVLETCPPERECATCPLEEDCHGKAKEADGFVSIDDAIRLKGRVSRETWESEMLCRRPSVKDCVFASFDPDVHVVEQAPFFGERELWLGIDFGYRAPFVCLWIVAYAQGFFVLDEYVQEQQTTDVHLEQMRRRGYHARKVGCDPAGSAKNEQTGKSSVQMLLDEGYDVRKRKSFIVDGLERIRAELRPGHGPPRLFFHPRCKHMIEAMKSYRYAEGGSEIPLKDGEHDHLIDALRYFFANYTKADGRPHCRY